MKYYHCLMAIPFIGLQTANASSLTPHVEEKDTWDFQITSYLWAPSLSGKISPFKNERTIDVKRSTSDVIDKFNPSSFVDLWAEHDRWVFSGNLMYSHGKDSQAYQQFTVQPMFAMASDGSYNIGLSGKAETTEFTATLMGGYRIVETPDYTLDLLGGIRYWYISNKLKMRVNYSPSIVHYLHYNEKFNWIDPLIGTKLTIPISERFSFQTELDAGGFGIGSDFTWSMLSSINYKFTDNLAASAGYRTFKVDYDRKGYVYNIRQNGPAIGLAWYF